MSFILGKKIEMSQIFDENGNIIPVTLVEAGPCKVLQLKNKEKDGYESIQIGFEEIKKESKFKKSSKGKNFKYIKEFFSEGNKLSEGEIIDLSVFNEGDKVMVSGVSKGKGFQGGVKRWGFAGAGNSHGIKHNKRKIGSIGSAYPQRVIKGRKMPGRMGQDRVTVKNLKIVKIEKEKNIILIEGSVPGKRGSLLEIQK
jgi:large subunit ribosomal protein L3